MREIPNLIYGFLRSHEDDVLYVYDDAFSLRNQPNIDVGYEPVGTLTSGVGHTGADIIPGMKVTQAISDRWLKADVHKAASGVCACVSPDVLKELTDHQYAALISFVFNLGVGALRKSTLLKRLNARQWDQVPLEFAKWNKATIGGKLVKLDGLVRRRAAEQVLWHTLEPGISEEFVPSSVTRTVPTPATPAEPKSPAKDPALLAGGGGLVSGAVATVADQAEKAQPLLDAANKVNESVSPWTWLVHVFASMPESVRMVLLGMALMLALTSMWRLYRQRTAARS